MRRLTSRVEWTRFLLQRLERVLPLSKRCETRWVFNDVKVSLCTVEGRGCRLDRTTCRLMASWGPNALTTGNSEQTNGRTLVPPNVHRTCTGRE